MIAFSVVFIEIILKLICFFSKFNNTVSLIIFITSVISFFGYYIILVIQMLLFKTFNFADRIVIQLFFLFAVFIIFLIGFNAKSYKLINIFFFLFSIITFTNSFILFNQNKGINEDNNSESRDNFVSNALSKPTILIITDEYSSPDELYNALKDSSIYDFSNYLKSKKWIVRNRSYSYETSTIHSLGSMFNYNLSICGNFQNYDIEKLAIHKLIKSKLYRDLNNNHTQVINFGIFDFGSSKPLTRLYYYPKSFLESFFSNSFYHVMRIPLLNLFNRNRDLSYYPMEEHNKFILKHLCDTLSNSGKENIFLYAHLYMPHSPIIFRPEINLLSNNFTNYLLYWNFTNKKLKNLIYNLTINDKYKIIITGDHGLKGHGKINPKLTFSAFYGFDKSQLETVHSIQDFGKLIIRNN